MSATHACVLYLAHGRHYRCLAATTAASRHQPHIQTSCQRHLVTPNLPFWQTPLFLDESYHLSSYLQEIGANR